MNLQLKQELEELYDRKVWEHFSLGEFVHELSRHYGDKLAIKDGEVEMSYHEVDKMSSVCAARLKELGYRKDDKVLIQLPNGWELVLILFGLFKIGAIPVLCHIAYRKNELTRIVEKVELKGYIGVLEYQSFLYEEMIKNIKSELNLDMMVHILEKEQFFCGMPDGRNCVEIETNYKSLGILLLSSGTTGEPKVIPMKHCELIYNAKQLADVMELNSETRYLVSLPMVHKLALCGPGVLGVMSRGGCVVISKNSSPDEIIPLISECRISHSAFVPALAKLCVKYLEFENTDTSSLIALQIGGAYLDPRDASKVESAFRCPVTQLYGVTEGIAICSRPTDSWFHRIYTQGRLISDYDRTKIVDENDELVDIGEYGELLVRGPYTIYEYYSGQEKNEKIVDEELYFRTGDKVRKLPDGSYQVAGRLREMINKAGEKIMPSELESILLEHEKIDEVQVVGVPDELQGEKIVVYLLSNSGVTSLSEIINFLRSKGIAQFKTPDALEFVDNWPLTSIGKISKEKLIAQTKVL